MPTTLQDKIAELRKAEAEKVRLAEAKEAARPKSFTPPNLTGLTVMEGVKRDHEVMTRALNTPALVSTDISHTPLWVLLLLHERAYRECSIDYNKGLSSLIRWLSPIAIPSNSPINYPSLLGSQRISIIAELAETTEAVITHCLLTEVMPRLERKS